jgi:hypothetical protein
VAALPVLAIETGSPGAPPTLPPPPPPPLTNATPGATQPPPPKPRPAPPASTTSTSPPPPPADTGASSSGSAPDHALDTRWFLAAMVGFLSEDYSAGLGIRGGKTLDNPHIYIGGTFIDQFSDVGINSFYFGPEGGYDFDLKYVVVRPYIGVGLFSSAPETEPVLWLGGAVIWNIPSSAFFIGGDLRLVSAPLTPIGAYFMAGIHFGT